MRTRQLNHATYRHLYHVVWGTKYRYKWLKPYVKKELLASLDEVCEKYPTLHVAAANVDRDHVHLQVEIAPSVAVSEAVQKLKSLTSGKIRRKFKFIREMYLETDGIWGVGYFSSTTGIDEEIIRRYITLQGEHEAPQAQTALGFE
jgi:putative transposase